MQSTSHARTTTSIISLCSTLTPKRPSKTSRGSGRRSTSDPPSLLAPPVPSALVPLFRPRQQLYSYVPNHSSHAPPRRCFHPSCPSAPALIDSPVCSIPSCQENVVHLSTIPLLFDDTPFPFSTPSKDSKTEKGKDSILPPSLVPSLSLQAQTLPSKMKNCHECFLTVHPARLASHSAAVNLWTVGTTTEGLAKVFCIGGKLRGVSGEERERRGGWGNVPWRSGHQSTPHGSRHSQPLQRSQRIKRQ